MNWNPKHVRLIAPLHCDRFGNTRTEWTGWRNHGAEKIMPTGTVVEIDYLADDSASFHKVGQTTVYLTSRSEWDNATNPS